MIDNVNDDKKAEGYIIPAGSMFPLGCAIPNNTVSDTGTIRHEVDWTIVEIDVTGLDH